MTALTTGRAGANLLKASIFWNRRLLCTIANPMTINTTASPRLKATISESPRSRRLMATATNRMAIASGQGTSPPLTPRAINERQVTLSVSGI